jgi:thiol:disulfide interchange protein DsbD
MKKKAVLTILAVLVTSFGLAAQGFENEPVFSATLVADRSPLVAGDGVRFAIVVTIDDGWHINSDSPGDDYSVPTELEWRLPQGWQEPIVSFPSGHPITFSFSENPIYVWEEEAVIVASATVPVESQGAIELAVKVTAQACNNTQCLPPTDVLAKIKLEVAAAGTPTQAANSEVFAAVVSTAGAGGDEVSELDDHSLPWLLVIVFIAGLGLNLTPCVFPLIPITIGFFTQQTEGGKGSPFWLALFYVLGIALTYSILGVAAALTGALFGAALQNPLVVGLIVVVLLALATSMFGLWELRVPGWAQRASGGRGGVFGALLMGLVMGFVAAPCIGPFVLGLLTYVGQRGDPVLGFVLFFVLALGLGLPYLVLGTFTGLMNRLPASGMWMIGVRRVFGVVLIAMAAYFAAPLLPEPLSGWLMGTVLVIGALYLLVIDRTGHDQPGVDRAMRLLAAVMLVVGYAFLPIGAVAVSADDAVAEGHLVWQEFEANKAADAIAAGDLVILDFYADWCAPCKELDEKTFSDGRVQDLLSDYQRYKVDLTRSNAENNQIAQDFGVRGVPTVIVFQNGEELFRLTGFEGPDPFMRRFD